ncbi:translation initiation factor IF-2 [Haoranjiania flava]|uniref:Translation initiation factor IF-2 n=1 Tax=Haoranjiania flava TaxID=1856322 RepID=A0AAE3INK6_9BACT|nr:translation initiation factor IF-2 [Haoranjiania flava]MCU7693616.1 translation initiation factor IF-2 [Haoranjiania flava]
MSEIKLPRLLAAAKEFNIGAETLIDFLDSKGFNRDELKPSAKLSEDMYRALQSEFQSDKLAKNKADQIEIPKSAGAVVEKDKERKKKDVIAPKPVVEEKTEEKEEEKPEAAPLLEEKKQEPVQPEPEPVAAPEPVEITPAEPAQAEIPPVAKQEEAPVVKQEAPAPVEEKQEAIPEEAEVIQPKAPELEAPKVINKIDLSEIDSSTRPKKAAPKKTEAPKEPKKEKPLATEAPKVEMPEVKPAPEAAAPPQEAPPAQKEENVVEHIHLKVDKLEGPKILGKIQLPVDNDTRPKAGRNEKRKRKRIPIDKAGQDTKGTDTTPTENKPGFNKDQRTGQQQGGRQGGQHQHGRPPHGQRDNRFGANRNRPGSKGKVQTPEEKEIDQKRIQEKIRETQAKLAGTGSKAKTRAQYRKERRQEMADAAMSEKENADNKLQVTEFITVSELANLMDVNFTDVIAKCMGLGIMVSINQRLDAEVIELVAGEFDYEVEFLGLDDMNEEEDEEEDDDPEALKPRYPIVTIMGHVDHGKTSLLDHIRSANVVAGEAGGITQHIGAYVVEVPGGKKITFLDTPGHEAFTAMRARGAKITDVTVIVIAADDAVMPQTKEAISHAQAAGVPIIFAINKIDKEGANPQKIYEQLSQMNLLVEEWGGKFQSQEISAKQGLNVDLLKEKILLEAELLDLKANPEREATGSIIEASLDKGRGFVATLLVQNGTLRQGDLVVSGQYFGRVKAMFNERNQRIDAAGPSTPVQILGLNGAPQAGERFKVYADEAEAKDVANKRAQILREQGLRTRKHITLDEIGRRLALGNFKELNVIIKGDVDGSVEALSDSLQKLSTEEIMVSVVHKAVGQISESDVLLATASDAIIIGFNVRPSLQAARLAEGEGVQIKSYSIIYDAINELKSAMEGMLEPKVEQKEVATVEIREVYKFDKATVAGCYVLEGKVKRDHKIKVFRDGILVFPRQEGGFGELASLKRFKDDVKEVAQGYECGLTVKNYADIQVGDHVVAYEEEEIKRTL